MNPNFYNPANAGKWSYDPNLRVLAETASDYRNQAGIKASASDRKRVALLIIDGQRDFGIPPEFDSKGVQVAGGTLYVGGRSGTGAVDDSRRTAEFIYREMGSITSVIPTMDTHMAFQIFTPSFWRDDQGRELLPHDMIDGNMQVIRGGKSSGLRASVNPTITRDVMGNPNAYMELQKQTEYYAAELARTGKYMLYIWPEHCVLGSMGHTLVGVIQEARMFHSYVRGAQNQPRVKGGNPLTENYSIFGPEVTSRYDSKGMIAQKDSAFLNLLLAYDAVIIGGQASSHCVKSSIDDLLGEIRSKDPALAQKVYVLRDCTSAVVVPGVVDFTEQAEKALDAYAAAGMNIVSSTDSMSSWLK
jgi:nicotinamidase-related amidase